MSLESADTKVYAIAAWEMPGIKTRSWISCLFVDMGEQVYLSWLHIFTKESLAIWE